jgi:hypothetical protein
MNIEQILKDTRRKQRLASQAFRAFFWAGMLGIATIRALRDRGFSVGIAQRAHGLFRRVHDLREHFGQRREASTYRAPEDDWDGQVH